ncbi:MAG: hypothetical protein JNL70_07720 [Saprospiraceae bacterium]|nr:hypothetical protein [Saprospiraceae bacterium]
MIQNVLNDIIKVLRGKNGNIFLIVGAIVLVLFFLRIMGPLLWLLIVGSLVYFVFKYLENKN